ncbi:hypothetical protein E4665_17645 [Sporolactobacillus shoreae]|uniref:DUF3168 domain-containing protein n=1 Tax=Sporolactobacillus shoreae TaxID=1465501 RepID=A0A4Z0GHZ7_9BACL|nr:hypothetical protein [Sporolactobacillus shoreae]TGA95709.1 hypothetical protein E4665_17645 [Sporolactobacillus shoreae]
MTVQGEVNALLSADPTFSGIVPPEKIYSVDSPLVTEGFAPYALITCISNPKTKFASNRSFEEQNNVQIQVWLPLDSEQVDTVMQVVDTVMEDHRFYRYHEMDGKDPTIDLYMITMQYRRNRIY